MKTFPDPRLCECGCGHPAPIAKKTDRRDGVRKGEPLRFISGHNRRNTTDLSRWFEADGGYETPCWLWAGSLTRKGYGRAQVNGEHTGAHRAMYEAANGALPRNAQLDHLCRNRRCVRPEHMDVVTNAVNSQRASRSRLSYTLVRAIRSSTLPSTLIAKTVGVSRQAISDVRRGHTWQGAAVEVAGEAAYQRMADRLVRLIGEAAARIGPDSHHRGSATPVVEACEGRSAEKGAG